MTSILAIDPGNVQSGYVILGDEMRILHAGVMNNAVMRHEINRYVRSLDVLSPVVAIEGIQALGMPVGKEVFDTCRWIGRFEEIVAGRIGVREARIVYRRDIKLHFCGQARAKDQNIRQALIDRLGAPGTKKNKGPTYGITSHAWSALAVALYALDNPEL